MCIVAKHGELGDVVTVRNGKKTWARVSHVHSEHIVWRVCVGPVNPFARYVVTHSQQPIVAALGLDVHNSR